MNLDDEGCIFLLKFTFDDFVAYRKFQENTGKIKLLVNSVVWNHWKKQKKYMKNKDIHVHQVIVRRMKK